MLSNILQNSQLIKTNPKLSLIVVKSQAGNASISVAALCALQSSYRSANRNKKLRVGINPTLNSVGYLPVNLSVTSVCLKAATYVYCQILNSATSR